MNLRALILPVLALLALLVFGWGGAQSSEDHNGIKPLNKELYVVGAFEDKSRLLSHKQLAKLSDTEFQFVGDAPAFGFTASHQWIKVRVFNFADHKTGRILEVNNPILNRCDLYEIVGNDAALLYSAGDDGPFSSRPIAHLNYQFPLEMMPNSTREFLLLVSSGGEQLQVPLGLWSNTDITLRDEKDRLLKGIYFGIILFVLLFNLFLYLIIVERSSMYYVAYIFFLMMLQLSLGGFAYRYFWPDSSYLVNVANPFFASLSIFALIRFSQTFLQLSEFYPKLNKAFS